MVVTASYALDGVPFSTADVTGSVTVSPSTLTDGVTSVTISYTDGTGTTVTTTQAVTVTHKLSSIAVTTDPTTTTYEYGDTFSSSGMVVTATYSDSTTATVTPTSISPTSLTTVGTQTITISYKDDSVSSAVTTTISVTVNRKSVSIPTWKGTLTYSGSSQSAASTSYWNNYNTSYMTIGGTTSGTNAGSYTATFSLGSNYRWSDGTTASKSVTWSIAKATGSLSLSSTSVAISASNYSSGVTVTATRSGDGTISVSSSNSTACPVSISGTTITIKGDGSTAGTYTVTVSVAAGTNYTAPSSKTITVTATYWEWGSETATGNASWWSGLKSWAAGTTASNRSACVGKTKSVTLSSAVSGTTTHLVRCIGADIDGTGTLTFQTSNCMATTTAFGSSAVYSGSTVESLCTSYYNAFPGKSYIKSLSKGTNTSYNTSSVSYSTYYVWLPSIYEVGLSSYTYKPAGAEYTSGVSTAYPYYSSNSTRIKTLGDSGSADFWWTRSRSSYASVCVCSVSSSGAAYGDYSGYGGGYGLAPAFCIG